jgi:pimeloyl-ACP methyl ester carboxylesterase
VRRIDERRLSVACDGLELVGAALVPDDPKGAAVLLHGLPSAAPPDPADRGYAGLAARFAARGWIAVWADMRSVRESPGFFSIEGWVRDATAIVERTRRLDEGSGLPLALIGSSAGASVSVEAARRGAELDALVLLASPAAWLSFAADPSTGVRRVLAETGMRLTPEVLADPAAWGAEFAGVVTERSIAHVDVPVLIVHGMADDVIPVEHAHRIARAARRATLRIVPGASHRLRAHDGVIDAVLEWLEHELL